MPITHNKKRVPLLNLLINCISTRSAPQILSLKDECAFHFSNFLIIGLCNSSVNFSFCSILFVTEPLARFLSKNL